MFEKTGCRCRVLGKIFLCGARDRARAVVVVVVEVVSCAVRVSSFWDGEWRKLGMGVEAEYTSSILGNWTSFCWWWYYYHRLAVVIVVVVVLVLGDRDILKIDCSAWRSTMTMILAVIDREWAAASTSTPMIFLAGCLTIKKGF